MEKSDPRYRSFVQILHEELIPAMGCTEPIAIAYCAAKARDVLGAYPDRVKVEVSGNIIKIVKSVIVPNTDGRKRIMQIHARKMAVSDNVNFDELARSTEGFNGAQCKAVCIEAGMAAIRKNKNEIAFDNYWENIKKNK